MEPKKVSPKRPRKQRSKEELQSQHRKDMAYSVDRIQHWTGQLVKQMSSRKYSTTQADIDKIIQAMQNVLGDVQAVATPKVAQESKKFSLD